jgi:hypothetical protein
VLLFVGHGIEKEEVIERGKEKYGRSVREFAVYGSSWPTRAGRARGTGARRGGGTSRRG